MSTLRIVGTALALSFSAQLTQQAHAADQPEPVVTPPMLKDLVDQPGKEVLMITVVYPPGTVEHVHRHDAHAFLRTAVAAGPTTESEK
jgi:quercetin dioxygenase-like cupin family protein